jgi:hypothetical protein
MTKMEILKLTLSFLSGGAVSAWLNWWLSQRSTRKRDEREMLAEQLRVLYGPLSFYVSQNRVLFKLADGIVNAAKSDDLNPKSPDGTSTSLVTTDEFKAVIDISNDYVGFVDKNNDRILALLEENWMYVDPRDSSLFMRMVNDFLRSRIEKDEEGKWRASLLICMQTHKISFMLPQFADRVDERATEIQTRLGLRGKPKKESDNKGVQATK